MPESKQAMNSRVICGFAIVGAAAGAVVSVALLAGPAAHADDVATLPIPPFDPLYGNAIFLPGAGGDWTNVQNSGYPSYEVQYDQAYTLPDGNYEIHGILEPYPGDPYTTFSSGSEQVISSEGVAPAVGTEWTGESFVIPAFGDQFSIFANSSLTTSAGTVDLFTWQQAPVWANEFYSGPAGIFDDIVNYNASTAIPIIDLPATASTGAAADFGTLWSELFGTL
jgi:hypothetical protein